MAMAKKIKQHEQIYIGFEAPSTSKRLATSYSMKFSQQKTNVFKIEVGFYFCTKSFPQKLIPRENFNNYYK